MSSFARRLCILFALLLVFGSLAVAALGQTTPKPAPAAKEEAKEEPVTEKGFRNRIFDIKYRDPQALQHVLVPLGSGMRGAVILPNRDFKTISVRDFPENIAAIEEALKRLDKPEAAAADVELRLHVLIAGASEAGAEPLPEELKEVVAALRPALAYKTYVPVAAAVQRVKDGTRGFNWSGQTERIESFFDGPGRRPTTLRWRITSLTLDRTNPERVAARIDGFDFEATQLGAGTIASLRTDVSLKDGEKVVVGTSTLRDKGLVLVLSARVVR